MLTCKDFIIFKDIGGNPVEKRLQCIQKEERKGSSQLGCLVAGGT
jgi:hypothetical protein